MLSIVPETKWRWRILAALLILCSGALHLRYISHECPLDLAPDEAHYWQWSRQLDSSYYSKGPLTAYIIRASCELFGESAFAVRLPAVIGGTLLLAGLYVLTARCFGDERLATLVAGITLTMPALAMSRTLMTIDSPFTCFWTWALVLGHQAFFRRSTWAWPALGVVIGLGILAKYTMALWIPSAMLFLAISAEHRSLLRRPGIWIACFIAAICCFPILRWNIQNDWVTFRHVGSQAGVTVEGNEIIRWFGPFKFVAEQCALLLGVGFTVWLAAAIALSPLRLSDPVRRYLWCMSVPLFLFFALFSFRTDVLPNWPVAAYLSGLVLAAVWIDEKRKAASPAKQRLIIGGLAAFTGCAALVSLLVHDTARLQPALSLLAGSPTPTNPQPLRRIDPTCRMRGWRHLNAAIDQIRVEMEAQQIDPILAASRWTLASEMAFYCDGHPQVYSVGSALWDRRSQFDLWRPNPVCDPDTFLGRSFLFVDVGPVPPEIRSAFERIEPTRTILYEERGQLIAFWNVTVCHGFRGFEKLPTRHY